MSGSESTESFKPLHVAATHLGVPVTWLRAEAEAGRVPHLKIGRRFMFNVEAVERHLVDRAAKSAGAPDGK
jgi:hypothetical protein